MFEGVNRDQSTRSNLSSLRLLRLLLAFKIKDFHLPSLRPRREKVSVYQTEPHLSLATPIGPGRMEFQVHNYRPNRRHKLLATCFFCGKNIFRKGDLDRVPVISEGSELQVPSCHSCYLTAKRQHLSPAPIPNRSHHPLDTHTNLCYYRDRRSQE